MESKINLFTLTSEFGGIVKDSGISKFYEKRIEERIGFVKEFADLERSEAELLRKEAALSLDAADKMIENVIGTIQLPLGIATNFVINGRPVLVPMAIEEPSVVAAASHAAKLAGGFEASSSAPIMLGQVQLVDVENIEGAVKEIEKNKQNIIENANDPESTIVKLGGGLKDVNTKKLESEMGGMLLVELEVDVRDAMGANMVNSYCEKLAPELERISRGKAVLKIVSNLCTKRTAKAKAVWKKELLGEEVIKGILQAHALAKANQYRCTTHNKGIMNGIDAVAVATGQDFRAIEAAAHSYAAMGGSYKPLTKYYRDENGDLAGEIEMPLSPAIVGGATKANPIAQISLKILGAKTAQELAEIMAAVGLANNFAALRAIVKEGIQKGHMRLHERKFREEKK